MIELPITEWMWKHFTQFRTIPKLDVGSLVSRLRIFLFRWIPVLRLIWALWHSSTTVSYLRGIHFVLANVPPGTITRSFAQFIWIFEQQKVSDFRTVLILHQADLKKYMIFYEIKFFVLVKLTAEIDLRLTDSFWNRFNA